VRAEQLQLALRPRAMVEAADLGVRIAQDAARSLRRAYLPFALLLVLACGATFELQPWLPGLLLWWAKPWLDRTLLEIYARQAFGQSIGFAEAWDAQRAAPWAGIMRALTTARLSFWRAYTAPVTQLEAQSGAARRERVQVLLNGHRGAAMLVQSVFSWCEGFVMLALLSLAAWLTPGLKSLGALGALFDGSSLGQAGLYLAYAAAVLFVEPFFVAAGFAMYLNRRVELEAWDVEQELRDAFDHA
jgi:hypothetical protein